MAEDITNPFSQIMGALTGTGKGEKGVRKDNRSGKVSPTLTPAEKARYESVFKIMKDVISPKAEARDIAENSAKGVGGKMVDAGKNMLKKKGKNEPSFAQMLGGLAFLATGLGAAIATLLDDVEASFLEIVDSIADFGGEVASDIGNLPAMALKLAKFLPLKKLKFIPLLGPLINFGMAYKHFKDDQIFEGLWELTSGVAGLFPGVGTAISVGMDIVKMIYESTAETDEEGNREDMGSWLLGIAKKMGMWLWERVKAGNVPFFSAAYRLGESLGMMLAGDVPGGLKNLMMVLPNFFGISGDNLKSMVGMFDAFMGSETGQKVKSGLSSAGDFISDLFTKMGDGISEFFSQIGDWVNGKIEEGINKVKGFFGFGDDEEEEKNRMAKQTAEIAARKAVRKKYIDKAKARLGDNWRKNMLEGETGLDYVNRQIKMEQQMEQSIIRYGTREDKIKAGLIIEDGLIYKNGQVTRFDNQDDILAAKSGGPIDKMLNTNSKVMTELNAISKNQLNVLMQIRDGIRALSSNKSSNGPTDITFEPSTLTQEFYAV